MCLISSTGYTPATKTERHWARRTRPRGTGAARTWRASRGRRRAAHGCLFDPGGISHAGWSNFGGLVLCCMDSYDSEKRRIFQHFSQSTQICNWIWEIVQAFAPIFKISPNFQFLIFQIFCKILQSCTHSVHSAIFRRKFHGFSPEFHRMLGNCSKSLDFADFSEIS